MDVCIEVRYNHGTSIHTRSLFHLYLCLYNTIGETLIEEINLDL